MDINTPKRSFFIPEIIPSTERMPVSGMTPSQAVQGAKFWWENVGRDFQRHHRDRKKDGIRDDEELEHESGILFGKPWDELDQRQQWAVVRAWHGEYCKANTGVNPHE